MKDKAALLAKLHRPPPLLILPNAWDAASARLFEEAGFPAIATTSAGIAWAHGHPDQQKISRDEMAHAVARIVEAVRVPVTADMEAGYGDVARTVNAVIDAGAVGMNLEDATHDAASPLFPLEEQVDRIQEARRAAEAKGVALVINARTDVFMQAAEPGVEQVFEAIRRLNAYKEAGADCLFAPGVRDRLRIEALAKAVRGPLNVLAGPGTPAVDELQAIGVARLSVGSTALRSALGHVRKLAKELRESGTYGALLADAVSYAEMNKLFE